MTMRNLITGLALASLPFSAALSEDITPTRLSVTITNVKAGQGSLSIGIYRENTWLSQTVAGGDIPASDDAVTAVFDLPGGGAYAVAVYQDLDGDGKMKSGFMGLPAEPYGFSNNAPIRFGPPKWEAARVDITEGETEPTSLTLKN
jgi:uncharacterized protein (DUF2141 family)